MIRIFFFFLNFIFCVHSGLYSVEFCNNTGDAAKFSPHFEPMSVSFATDEELHISLIRTRISFSDDIKWRINVRDDDGSFRGRTIYQGRFVVVSVTGPWSSVVAERNTEPQAVQVVLKDRKSSVLNSSIVIPLCITTTLQLSERNSAGICLVLNRVPSSMHYLQSWWNFHKDIGFSRLFVYSHLNISFDQSVVITRQLSRAQSKFAWHICGSNHRSQVEWIFYADSLKQFLLYDTKFAFVDQSSMNATLQRPSASLSDFFQSLKPNVGGIVIETFHCVNAEGPSLALVRARAFLAVDRSQSNFHKLRRDFGWRCASYSAPFDDSSSVFRWNDRFTRANCARVFANNNPLDLLFVASFNISVFSSLPDAVSSFYDSPHFHCGFDREVGLPKNGGSGWIVPLPLRQKNHRGGIWLQDSSVTSTSDPCNLQNASFGHWIPPVAEIERRAWRDCPKMRNASDFRITKNDCESHGHSPHRLQWLPESCRLPSFDVARFYNALERGKYRLVLVGDSVTQQHFYNLACAVEQRSSASEQLAFDFPDFHFFVLNHTLRVYYAGTLFGLQCIGCDQGNSNEPRASKLDVNKVDTSFQRFIQSPRSVIVFNVGAWFSTYKLVHLGMIHGGRNDLDDESDLFFERTLRAIFDNIIRNSRARFIIRTLSFAHENCDGSSLPSSGADEMYRWSAFQRRNAFIKKLVSEFAFDRVSVMDVETVSRGRADGHPGSFHHINSTTSADCLHWCNPGETSPLNIWNDLLLLALEELRLASV